MRMLRGWLVRFAGLFDKRRSEREIGDEIESNLQLHVDDGLREGMSPQEARRQALIRLGGIEAAKEAWRDRRGIPFLESLWKDVVYAFRTMGRSKGFVQTHGTSCDSGDPGRSNRHAISLSDVNPSK